MLLKRILGALDGVRGPDDAGFYTAWCPFHPDGEGNPPHQPNLRISSRGFYCHVCAEKGNLQKLATGLSLEPPVQARDELESVYSYTDENGTPLFEVVRFRGKQFRQRRPDGKGGWAWKLDGVRRVPYRLPGLLARPGEPVYVVEGEKDADRLHEEGLLATTNPGGAGKWKKDFSAFLQGRHVVVLPDNDDAGRSHATSVARSLVGHALSIRVLSLPGLPPKGDVSDWLDAGGDADQLGTMGATAPLWSEPAASADAGSRVADDTDDTDGSSGRNRTQQLVDRILELGVELFHDQRQEPFARIPGTAGRVIVSTASQPFRRFVTLVAYRDMSWSPSGETIRTVTRTLEAIASFERPQHDLHVRVAWHDNEIWIDLDGRRAVRVRPAGWSIVEVPPILFRSFAHQLPLAEPVRGGHPERVFEFLNLPPDEQRVLYLAYLVIGFVPDIPVPALIVHGPQGTAKTSLLKITKRLLDPSRVEVRGGVKDLPEYAQAASQNRMLAFDNLTWIPDWLSDALCRTVTGDGFAKRTLYTNEDTTILEIRSLVGITGINNVATRADLLDRSIILELTPLHPHRRREERDLWSHFDAARGEILGGILDALARAMALRPALKARNIPRMADAAKWGAAATEAFGLTPEDYLEAYRLNVGRQTSAALNESLVAQSVLRHMQDRSSWTGTASALLADLRAAAEAEHIDVRGPSWPKAANALSRRLNEARPALEARGISVERDHGDERSILLLRVAGSTDGIEGTVGASAPIDASASVSGNRGSADDDVLQVDSPSLEPPSSD